MLTGPAFVFFRRTEGHTLIPLHNFSTDPTRLRILGYLAGEPLSLAQIARRLLVPRRWRLLPR